MRTILNAFVKTCTYIGILIGCLAVFLATLVVIRFPSFLLLGLLAYWFYLNSRAKTNF